MYAYVYTPFLAKLLIRYNSFRMESKDGLPLYQSDEITRCYNINNSKIDLPINSQNSALLINLHHKMWKKLRCLLKCLMRSLWHSENYFSSNSANQVDLHKLRLLVSASLSLERIIPISQSCFEEERK